MTTIWWVLALILLNDGVLGQRRDGIIYGRITDGAGCSVPGVKLVAIQADDQAIATSITDVQGRYEITGLPRGSFRVTAESLGFRSESRELVVSRGRNLWDVGLTLGRLTDDPHSITGTVRNLEGRPVRDATVKLISTGSVELKEQSRSDAQGRFTISFMDGGHYILMASAPGYEVDAKPVVMPQDTEVTVSLHLRRSSICSTSKQEAR